MELILTLTAIKTKDFEDENKLLAICEFYHQLLSLLIFSLENRNDPIN